MRNHAEHHHHSISVPHPKFPEGLRRHNREIVTGATALVLALTAFGNANYESKDYRRQSTEGTHPTTHDTVQAQSIFEQGVGFPGAKTQIIGTPEAIQTRLPNGIIPKDGAVMVEVFKSPSA